ncbi:hypothetical protein PYJP_17200 [Pyrofollis japonicus]|nr:hypothetical protein PYJP_17200 [Pyrofollis japonicus]
MSKAGKEVARPEELLQRHRRLIEAVKGVEEEVWGSSGLLVNHAVLAALYAYRVALGEGADAEAVFVASLLSDAVTALEKKAGELCPRRRALLLEEALEKSGYPEELAKRVRRVLEDGESKRILGDADALAKLMLTGLLESAATRLNRGRDVLAAFLEAASRQLTAIANLDCLVSTRTAKRIARTLSERLRDTILSEIGEMRRLGLLVDVEERIEDGHQLVLVVPRRCPMCGAVLEAKEERNPGCGGVRISTVCGRCGWTYSVTVCPPPPCRS